MKLVSVPLTAEQQAVRADIVKRLLGCLTDADTLPLQWNGAVEICAAINRLGGEVPDPKA